MAPSVATSSFKKPPSRNLQQHKALHASMEWRILEREHLWAVNAGTRIRLSGCRMSLVEYQAGIVRLFMPIFAVMYSFGLPLLPK